MRNPLSLTYLAIAQRAKVPPALAVFVDVALREHAEGQAERGSIVNFDAEGCAIWGQVELRQVDAIMVAMAERGFICGGILVGVAPRAMTSSERSRRRRFRLSEEAAANVRRIANV